MIKLTEKKVRKLVLSCAAFAFVSFAAVKGNISPIYAQQRNQIPSDSLKIVEALQNSFRAVSDTVLPSVVEVDVTETKTYQNPFQGYGWPFGDFFGSPRGSEPKEYESKGLGSGVIVRRDGNIFYVLTNNHVAGSATKISVKLNDDREFEAKLVGADERQDIALVSFESTDRSIPVAVLGDSDKVHTGDLCFAMGAPLGYAQSVTQGIISATGRTETNMSNISDFIQTDASINQGNSGGPLVNIYGEIIGINTWIASQSGGSQGLGFAIPINNVKGSIDSFIKKGKVVYGWCGISINEINGDYQNALGVKDVKGAFVAEVFMNSPGFKGGLRPGDYIVELNGRPVKSVSQLIRDIGNIEAGSKASFVVIRGGKRIPPIEVKIDERDESVSTNNQKLWPGFIAVELTDELRTKLEISDKKVKGVVVTSVFEKSPAASMRIQNGDLITAVNGKPVKSIAEFYQELANAGKSVNFDVYSNGGTITTGTYKF